MIFPLVVAKSTKLSYTELNPGLSQFSFLIIVPVVIDQMIAMLSDPNETN
jgi:hypothetical protein